MKAKLFTILTMSSMLFLSYGCSEDVPANEQSQTTTSHSTKSVKQDEPVEVTNFRNKLKEISRSGQQLTDSEKAILLLPEAKSLLEEFGLPDNIETPKQITTDDEKTAYLGFVKFMEIIKNK